MGSSIFRRIWSMLSQRVSVISVAPIGRTITSLTIHTRHRVTKKRCRAPDGEFLQRAPSRLKS